MATLNQVAWIALVIRFKCSETKSKGLNVRKEYSGLFDLSLQELIYFDGAGVRQETHDLSKYGYFFT